MTVLLAGPTAVGKSAIAMALAERIDAEIVSVDSMQVYRDMNIGTAKPSPEERGRVAHHLIDVAAVDEPFCVADFVRLAHAACSRIQESGRNTILCGGTGLYFKALLQGLDPLPPSDPGLRASLAATPIEALLDELARLDPTTFERIDRKNRRRVERALEIVRLTGKPMAQQRRAWHPPHENTRLGALACRIGFSRQPADLRVRVNCRIDAMFRAGLVEETRHLLERGLARNRTALQALGYRQVVEHLDGALSVSETVALVKSQTWQFARRQMTWFRHQAALDWIALDPDSHPAALAERLAETVKRIREH